MRDLKGHNSTNASTAVITRDMILLRRRPDFCSRKQFLIRPSANLSLSMAECFNLSIATVATLVIIYTYLRVEINASLA